MTSDEDITYFQNRAAEDVVKNSVITCTILTSGLVFQIDIRDIFRWERSMIKKGIQYQMVDRRTGLIVGKHTGPETIMVPEDYNAR